MSSSKDKYRSLCRTEDSIPIFLKDWWLDAVSDEQWDVALLEEGGTIKAAMPYRTVRKMGFKLLNMPTLTSGWGPWIKYPADQKYASRLSYEHQTITQLISQLPSFDYFNQRFRYTITNGLPYYWKGFSLTTRYTYVIRDLQQLDKVWNTMSSSARSQIRKAEKTVRVIITEDVTDLYRLSVSLFKRQKEKIPYTLEFLKKLDVACKEHQSGRIFLAVDENNRVQASLYLVWDKQSAYYLGGGTDPEAVGGTFSLLMWKAIEYAATVTCEFNFEGSMLESVERFFRSFGPEQIPYLQVQKVNSTSLKLAKLVNVI